MPFGESYFLHPRAFVLATTLEWIRLPSDIAAYVIGRSSWGRRGLIIATATGVHPGFKGCLTLEITNVGEIPIAIKPGMAICQLFFHEVRGPLTKSIDRSQFAGSRKPAIGRIKPDAFFRKLTNRPQLAWILSNYKSSLNEKSDGGDVTSETTSPMDYLDEESARYIVSLPPDERQTVEAQLADIFAKIGTDYTPLMVPPIGDKAVDPLTDITSGLSALHLNTKGEDQG